MTINNVSSAYLNSALLPAVRQAQSQLSTLETESATGQYADLGLQLGGQSGYELSLRTQDDLLQTLTSAEFDAILGHHGIGVDSTDARRDQSATTDLGR
jgi:hypothetical protein